MQLQHGAAFHQEGGCSRGRGEAESSTTRSQASGKRITSDDFICVATGPSLTKYDCEKAARSPAQVIAVNDAYRLIPDADILYACDQRWWQIHIDAVRATFAGKLYTQFQKKEGQKEPPPEKVYADENGITAVEGQHQIGLGRDRIHYGSNSGFQAINLAYLLGARRRIFLLGYDMQKTGGKSHFFGSHPKGLTDGNYSGFVRLFDALAADLKSEGVEVINLTRETALTQFQRGSVGDWLRPADLGAVDSINDSHTQGAA